MTKDTLAETELQEKEKKQLLKFIQGREYMIKQVENEMKTFLFKDFDGSYNEYLLARRRKYQYRIDTYKDDIENTKAQLEGRFVSENYYY